MEELVTNKRAFIRPSPAGTSLGGVAQKTRETIILCEAAGFDTIIIETVGVGQSETMVHSMVEFFLTSKNSWCGSNKARLLVTNSSILVLSPKILPLLIELLGSIASTATFFFFFS